MLVGRVPYYEQERLIVSQFCEFLLGNVKPGECICGRGYSETKLQLLRGRVKRVCVAFDILQCPFAERPDQSLKNYSLCCLSRQSSLFRDLDWEPDGRKSARSV